MSIVRTPKRPLRLLMAAEAMYLCEVYPKSAARPEIGTLECFRYDRLPPAKPPLFGGIGLGSRATADACNVIDNLLGADEPCFRVFGFAIIGDRRFYKIGGEEQRDPDREYHCHIAYFSQNERGDADRDDKCKHRSPTQGGRQAQCENHRRDRDQRKLSESN